MRLAPLLLVVLASVAMFSMQTSGLHLHIGEHSANGVLHGAHIHSIDPDGHDHGTDGEVSVHDVGVMWSKIVAVLLTVLPTLLVVVWILRTLGPPPVPVPARRWRVRWRPPLRAPPLLP